MIFPTRASLVAQWLRIHLPMQGTWVRALVQEDPTCRGATKPVCHNYWAYALKPVSHKYWRPSPSPSHVWIRSSSCVLLYYPIIVVNTLYCYYIVTWLLHLSNINPLEGKKYLPFNPQCWAQCLVMHARFSIIYWNDLVWLRSQLSESTYYPGIFLTESPRSIKQ